MESGGKQRSDVSYALYHFSTSGAAVAVATAVTHPLDVLKVRLQMQLAGQRGNLVGMGELSAQIIKSEGPRALYLGLGPALTRSVLYGGLRLGLYEPCKYICDYMFGSTNFLVKVASGAFSGAIATSLTNPTEVLKVRLQMNSNARRGPIREMHKIVSKEGIRALWKGVGPAMARAGCLTASQMATYDESKEITSFTFLRFRPCSNGHPLKKLKLHSWNSRKPCNSTNGHDQNPPYVATRIQECQKLQKWIPLCLPGCVYRGLQSTL
ncbi:mitochondrial substrate carrier family protein ucpB isoform X4 [Phoenix dactylifera]|uniref:Mitochondrial substrate carrier family protein ucpB isoform X4 n=1 Tax=Phoenix dactylifera TaxID=42345 RepID=A0A8B7C631_PHODC|nr:mitochondrial substrate carrier family protein ucpB isoform X4 [Phoenix dactylifera]XP_008792580.1 mitochondrial substrate carrier family protein ucpB isoform X4 [Phoenix dactylifera]XP_038981193.1 mitochondrial substrate carrier family protein ucpB isoform X4 [Phoenix dactylifera]